MFTPSRLTSIQSDEKSQFFLASEIHIYNRTAIPPLHKFLPTRFFYKFLSCCSVHTTIFIRVTSAMLEHGIGIVTRFPEKYSWLYCGETQLHTLRLVFV